jgi:LemA protein
MAWVILGIVLVLILVPIAMSVGIYNKLVKLRNAMKNAWSQIDVLLKRRYDLIPNLVETAKGYMQHERETLDAVMAARSGAGAARQQGDVGKQVRAENALGAAIGGFMATVEAYPELKADRQMSQLMGELTSTENQIAGARSAYNNSVNTMNDAVETFPSSIIAGMFNFEKGVYFEVDEPEVREAPKVSFS